MLQNSARMSPRLPPRVGEVVTARWTTHSAGMAAAGPSESHVSATGVVKSIDRECVTLECGGALVDIRASWICE